MRFLPASSQLAPRGGVTPAILVMIACQSLSTYLALPRRSATYRLLLARRSGDNRSFMYPFLPLVRESLARQIELYGAGSDEAPVELLVWATGFSGNGHQ